MYRQQDILSLRFSPPNYPFFFLLPIPVIYISQLLLQKVLGPMISLIIDMYIGALNVGQTLKFNLQLLCYIVCAAERVFRIHNNVYFDNKAGA